MLIYPDNMDVLIRINGGHEMQSRNTVVTICKKYGEKCAYSYNKDLERLFGIILSVNNFKVSMLNEWVVGTVQ